MCVAAFSKYAGRNSIGNVLRPSEFVESEPLEKGLQVNNTENGTD